MVEHKLASFVAVVALRTIVGNFSNKANTHTSKVKIHVTQKLCYFGRYDAKAELFCLRRFVPVTRDGMFLWENFHTG